MLTDWTGSPAWTAAGWTMIHFLWLGTVIGVTGRFVGRTLLRRAPPPFRYTSSLITLAALVLTAGFLFGNQLRRANATTPAWLAAQAQSPGAVAPDAAAATALAGSASSHAIAATRRAHGLHPGRAGLYDWAAFSNALAAQAPWVWLAGTPLTLLGLALGLAGASRLRRQGVALADGWVADLCARLRRTLGITREVAIVLSDRVLSPVLVGVVKPVILLPPALLSGWTPAQVEMILLHELAHVRRWDALVNLGQRLIEALLFFHPMIWVVSRWVQVEREECCDAVVIRHNGDPRGYAEALALLATTTPKLTPMPILAVGRHPVVHRIQRILQVEDGWLPMPGELVAGAAALLLAFLVLPNLATFILNTPRPDKAPEVPPIESNRAPVPMRQRLLHFPEDRSPGRVFVRKAPAMDASPYYLDNRRGAGWTNLGAARGAVLVPAGNDVRLLVEGTPALRDLSPLAVLRPDDLDELAIFCWGSPQLQAEGTIFTHLSHLTGLKALSVEPTQVTPRGLSLLKGLRALRHLSIRCPPSQASLPPTPQFDEACLAQLAKLSTLESLCLADADISDQGVGYLAELSNLSELELWSPRLDGPGLAQLQRLPSLRSLRLAGSGLTENCLPPLAGLRALRKLNIGDLEITDAGVAHLSTLTRLEELSVVGGGLTARGISMLKPLQALKELEVNQGGKPALLGDAAAGPLQALKSLERLSLYNCGFTDTGLGQLAALSHLRSLRLPNGRSGGPAMEEACYTDAGLEALSRLAGLETLVIDSPAVTDEGLSHLGKLRRLKELHVSAPRVGNAGLAALASLGALESLTLHTPEVTLSGLNRLHALSRLRWLDATPIRQDNQGLDLSQLTRLEELRIGLTQVGEGGVLRTDRFRDEDMAGLASLTRLRWLRGIRGVSDAGMKHLANLTAMEGLDIGGSEVTDAGLAHLAVMRKLKHLNISGKFTDAGLRRLEGISSLRSLCIEPAGQVSREGIQRLQARLPELQVTEGAKFGGGG